MLNDQLRLGEPNHTHSFSHTMEERTHGRVRYAFRNTAKRPKELSEAPSENAVKRIQKLSEAH